MGEDSLDRRHHRRRLFGRHRRADGPHELHPAPLPGRTGKLLPHRGFQPSKGIGDRQMRPGKPRTLSPVRNSRRKSNDSLFPTAAPRTSRVPSIVAPVAATKACETTWAPICTLQYVASRTIRGNVVWVSVHSRNLATSVSRPAQIRETCHFEIPESTPQRRHKVIDVAGRDTVHVGLHDHRMQRLIDAQAPLDQAGKNDPGRSFGFSTSASLLVWRWSSHGCRFR